MFENRRSDQRPPNQGATPHSESPVGECAVSLQTARLGPRGGALLSAFLALPPLSGESKPACYVCGGESS